MPHITPQMQGSMAAASMGATPVLDRVDYSSLYCLEYLWIRDGMGDYQFIFRIPSIKSLAGWER